MSFLESELYKVTELCKAAQQEMSGGGAKLHLYLPPLPISPITS